MPTASETDISDPTPLHDLAFDRMLNALHDEVVVTDAYGTIVFANEPWRRFCAANGGDIETSYVGTNYFGICASATGESDAEARIIPDALSRVLDQGEIFRCEYPCDSPTEKRWFEMYATRLDHAGVRYLVIQHRNITTRKRDTEDVEQAVADANALAALVASTTDAILSYDLDGNIITWNPGAERLYGYKPEEIIGRSLDTLYPSGWPVTVATYRDQILAGELTSFEATRVGKDGADHEVWITCAPIRGIDGDIVAISNVHRDVTEVRKAEKTRDIIAHEVIHRAKNMLSIVSAIQRQTAQTETTIEGFSRSFEARIRSLSSSTDLLVEGDWTTVSLHDLTTRQLRPFAKSEDPRLTINGPTVQLQPQAVQMIGVALHELATNAAKYGGLNQPSGKIEISWAPTATSTGSLLNFVWAETCAVTSEAMSKPGGFGRKVLQMLAPTMLNTTSSYNLAGDRVHWSIDLPAELFFVPPDPATLH